MAGKHHSTPLDRIQYPALSAWQVGSFVLAVCLQLPFYAPIWSLIEAGLIWLLFYPAGLVLELLVDRSRTRQPVKWTVLQEATLKVTQLAFGFFDYTLGRAVFSDAASTTLMHRRIGNKKIFDLICHKTELVFGDGKKVSGWWIGMPGRGKDMAEGVHQAHPSPVLVYLNGGGFVMARPAFYLEFLHKLRTTLAHSHPQLGDVLIFAPEYPLVPETVHPGQAEAVRLAYEYVATRHGIDPNRIMLAGDSAGAHLALGLRLAIANSQEQAFAAYRDLPLPSQMVLISPFVELDVPSVPPKGSSMITNAPYDFVDPYNLAFFAQLFSGTAKPSDRPSGLKAFIKRKTTFALLFPQPNSTASAKKVRTQSKSEVEHLKLCEADPLLSPGTHAARLLQNASNGKSVPTLVVYGTGEVLADQSKRLVQSLGKQGAELTAPYVHAWPIVLFNLGRNQAERKSGVMAIAAWLSKEHSGVRLNLPSHASVQSIALLPGSYSSDTLINGANDTLSTFLGSSAASSAQPGFVFTSPTVGLDNATLAIFYSDSLLFGEPKVITENGTLALSARSLLLAPNLVADMQIGSSLVSLYDGVADIGNLPATGSLTLLNIEGASCTCSTGGTCSLIGTCLCNPGFTGSSCSDCAQGFFGPACQPCSCDAASCSSGITGSGRCPVAANATSAACNCVNGLCTSSNTCSCSAGWADQPGGKRCSVPAIGFALQSNGQLTSCAPGCKTCTANQCTACQDGLDVSDAGCSPSRFIPAGSTNNTFTSCPDGQFNPGNGQCVACDAACATCFGVGDGHCLKCATPRMWLQGQCVNLDVKTGMCDKEGSALTVNLGANAAFLANNAKNACDPAPANCTSANIASFSSTAAFSSLSCTGCLPGTALLNGDCVATCPAGQFALSNGNSTAVCTACDSSCASCSAANAKSCTACAPGSLLRQDGSCVKGASCPTGTFASSGVCLSCSSECESCSGTATSCTACATSRPALVNGRCLARCPKGQGLSGNSCQSCDSSCATCSGPDAKQCLSCDGSRTLKAGSCVAANCAGGAQTIPGPGVCLEALLTIVPPAAAQSASSSTSSSPNIGAIVGGTAGGVSLLSALLYILRKVRIRKRKENTKQFGREKNLEDFGNVMKAVRKAQTKLAKEKPKRRATKDTISSPLPMQAEEERAEWPPIYRTQLATPARPTTPVIGRSARTKPFLSLPSDSSSNRHDTLNNSPRPLSPSYPPW